MSKLDTTYNSFFDNLIAEIYTPLLPACYELNITPNCMTTMSLCCGLYSTHLVWEGQPCKATAFYLINYVFDCMDGAMARTYHMESEFGDWYDHLTDWFTFGIILHAVYKNNDFSIQTKCCILSTFVILVYTTSVWMGCQQKEYGNSNGSSLSMTESMCTDQQMLHTFKDLSCSTLVIFVAVLILMTKRQFQHAKYTPIVI